MAEPIVVFDLDGTLVDTAPDLLDSLNSTLIAGGAAPTDVSGFRAFVGHGGRVMIERAYAAQRRVLKKNEHDRLFSMFLDHYGKGIPGESKLYPGVERALNALAAAGYRLAVCTNKTEDFSKRLLAGLGVAARFAAICGADTFPFRKPDPRHLTATIAMADGDPQRAVMVGDSRTDIDTAKSAGVPVIAVDYGYTDVHVREFEPTRILSDFAEITPVLCNALIAAANA